MENILQFKITLKEIRPLIWRRIQVTDDYRFDRFHQVIQIAMGWWNYHLHEFHIKGREIGMPDDGYAYEFPNPTFFYINGINTELAKFAVWHRRHPRARSTPWHQI